MTYLPDGVLFMPTNSCFLHEQPMQVSCPITQHGQAIAFDQLKTLVAHNGQCCVLI
jgi:hypothetical protein